MRLPRDIDELRADLIAVKPDIFVLDPLAATVDSLGHLSGRNYLDQLIDLTTELDVSLVAVHHLTKSGVQIAGGAGVAAAARAIHVFGPAPLRAIPHVAQQFDFEDGDELDALSLLMPFKSSYGRPAPPLILRRRELPHPGDPSAETVATYEIVCELLRGSAHAEEEDVLPQRRKRDIIKRLIVRLLVGCRRTASELQVAVTELGINADTFETARAELRQEGVIESYQESGQHWWRIAVPDVVSFDG